MSLNYLICSLFYLNNACTYTVTEAEEDNTDNDMAGNDFTGSYVHLKSLKGQLN